MAWLVHYGAWPRTEEIDHVNGNKTDNRIANLREATQQQNQMHRTKVTGAVPFKGVYFNKQRQRFMAYINHNKRMRYLGLFDTAEAAARAYDAAAAQCFGPYAHFNLGPPAP